MPKDNQVAFDSYLVERQQRIEKALEVQLAGAESVSSNLHAAMCYAVFSGGKRLRPLLVYAIGEDCGVSPSVLDVPACAVELVHTFSLVHDDLPAMDDDDWRRGKPTCHRVFDEATAVLVGDALLALAFQSLTLNALSPEINILMLQALTQACGAAGMTGGQDLDIHLATAKTLTPESLLNIYYLKTGAMLEASVALGVLTAIDALDFGSCKLSRKQIFEEYKSVLVKFAYALGVAFQIQDDILECDLAIVDMYKLDVCEKIVYPTLVGLTAAQSKVNELFNEALAALDTLPFDAMRLRALTNHIMQRKY